MGDDNRETLRTEPSNPFADALQAKKAITLAAILCAVFGSILQSATLSTMLPIAAADIGGESYYSLASTIGTPLSIAAMPLWGYIAARSPHLKVPLLTASMACGVLAVALRLIAPNMLVIIGAMCRHQPDPVLLDGVECAACCYRHRSCRYGSNNREEAKRCHRPGSGYA